MTVTDEIAAPQAPGRLAETGRALMFTEARTANSFAPIPVSDEDLAEIWDLAKWGPTAANTQPMRVVYVRADEGRERLLRHMNEGNRAKTATAPAVAVLAVDTEFYEHIPEVLPFRPEARDVFAADAEMAARTSRFSSALQAGYFIMAVRAVGLAAGPMAGFDAEALDADFFPDGRWKSILVVNIGYPGENPWFGRLPRLPHDDVIRWA
jgi:3-hydroxypropanoate dehydrogenase